MCAGNKNGEKKHLRDTPKILTNGNELQISIVVSVNRYLSSMEYKNTNRLWEFRRKV